MHGFGNCHLIKKLLIWKKSVVVYKNKNIFCEVYQVSRTINFGSTSKQPFDHFSIIFHILFPYKFIEKVKKLKKDHFEFSYSDKIHI